MTTPRFPTRAGFRRAFISVAAGLLAFGSPLPAQTPASDDAFPAAPESASLKDSYGKFFLVGAALNARQYGDTDPATTGLIVREFNSATAENDMKWEIVEPKPNVFRFERGDKTEARTLLARALPVMRDSVLPQQFDRAEAEGLAKRLGLR